MIIKSAQDLIDSLRKSNPKRISVAVAEDKEVLSALFEAITLNIVRPILVGDSARIAEISREIGLDSDKVEIVHAGTAEEAIDKSMEEVSSGRAQVLMKGFVNTAAFLKAVLDKKYGLRKSCLLSHTALFFPEVYHKPVMVTDAALNLFPSLKDKIAIIDNAVHVMNRLGIETPKVALLAHNEVPTDKVPASMDALKIKSMNANGEIQGCIVDGPLSLDTAISYDACQHKNITSPVGGDADILICPDIISANILYKSMGFLAKAHCAAILSGAKIPIVVASRAEDARTKLLSIALAMNIL